MVNTSLLCPTITAIVGQVFCFPGSAKGEAPRLGAAIRQPYRVEEKSVDLCPVGLLLRGSLFNKGQRSNKYILMSLEGNVKSILIC